MIFIHFSIFKGCRVQFSYRFTTPMARPMRGREMKESDVYKVTTRITPLTTATADSGGGDQYDGIPNNGAYVCHAFECNIMLISLLTVPKCSVLP